MTTADGEGWSSTPSAAATAAPAERRSRKALTDRVRARLRDGDALVGARALRG